jgi:hypothetical protein
MKETGKLQRISKGDLVNLNSYIKAVRSSRGSVQGFKEDSKDKAVLVTFALALQAMFPTYWGLASDGTKRRLEESLKRKLTKLRSMGMCITGVQQIAFDDDILSNLPKTLAEAVKYVQPQQRHVGMYCTLSKDGLIPVAARQLANGRAFGVTKRTRDCFSTWTNAGILGARAKAATGLSHSEFAQLLEDNREEKRAAALLTA